MKDSRKELPTQFLRKVLEESLDKPQEKILKKNPRATNDGRVTEKKILKPGQNVKTILEKSWEKSMECRWNL